MITTVGLLNTALMQQESRAADISSKTFLLERRTGAVSRESHFSVWTIMTFLYWDFE